jgi:hypothetical protein
MGVKRAYGRAPSINKTNPYDKSRDQHDENKKDEREK